MNKVEYNRKYYSERQEELREARRKRYKSNPKVRAEARARAERYRRERSKGAPIERELFRQHKGKKTKVFTTGMVADRLGTYPMKIITWEKRDVIPPPIFDEYHRLYTKNQVDLLARLYDSMLSGSEKRIANAQEKIKTDWEA